MNDYIPQFNRIEPVNKKASWKISAVRATTKADRETCIAALDASDWDCRDAEQFIFKTRVEA